MAKMPSQCLFLFSPFSLTIWFLKHSFSLFLVRLVHTHMLLVSSWSDPGQMMRAYSSATSGQSGFVWICSFNCATREALPRMWRCTWRLCCPKSRFCLNKDILHVFHSGVRSSTRHSESQQLHNEKLGRVCSERNRVSSRVYSTEQDNLFQLLFGVRYWSHARDNSLITRSPVKETLQSPNLRWELYERKLVLQHTHHWESVLDLTLSRQ